MVLPPALPGRERGERKIPVRFGLGPEPGKAPIAMDQILIVVVLFAGASFFQTIAWYHDVEGKMPFYLGFLISMGFVVLEYGCMIPANQVGAKMFSLVQLALIVEVVNWTVFLLYVKFVKKEDVSSNSWVGISVMALGVLIAYS
jgi:uncharacterized protein (DUF486 family)